MWVWYWDDLVIATARRIGASYLLVKAADGAARWAQWPVAREACARAGLACWPWAYSYGAPEEVAALVDAGAEVIVLDPEVEYERLSTAAHATIVDAVATVKASDEGWVMSDEENGASSPHHSSGDASLVVGCACWAQPALHPGYGYDELARVVDEWLPMVAWQEWSPRDPGCWFEVWDRAGHRPTVPWLSASGVSGVELANAVRLAMERYGGAAIWAAHVLTEEQVSELEKAAVQAARADADFARYAPRTGTWREACVNLKGIADDALAAGRKVVADAAATWGTR